MLVFHQMLDLKNKKNKICIFLPTTLISWFSVDEGVLETF